MKRSPVVVTAFFVWLAAAPAHAQGYVTPFIGSPFNTDTPAGTLYGVEAGGMSKGVIGAEVEFAAAPDFFGHGPGANSMLTLTGNVLLGLPLGAFRPYGVAGLGLIRGHRELNVGGVFSDVTDNDFGYSLGGGANIRMADQFGLRMDVRRFQVRKTDGYGFNRYFFGVVFGNPG